MPRMYLHQRSGDLFIEDLEGAEFATVEDAVEAAAQAAWAIVTEQVSRGLAPDGRRFEIANTRGELLAVVPLQDVIPEDGPVAHARAAHWYRVDAI